MPASFFNKDFKGKRSASAPGRNLPGQYQTQGFSALSAGPTPRISLQHWRFTIEGLVESPPS